MFFSPKQSLKNIDLSCKTDLDFLGCFGVQKNPSNSSTDTVLVVALCGTSKAQFPTFLSDLFLLILI